MRLLAPCQLLLWACALLACTLLACTLLACSTDPEPPQGDAGQGLSCSTAIIGKVCSATGGECGADHVCLPVAASGAGFCSCSCTPDDLTTPASEESCPGKNLVCARHTPPGGVAGDYCFAFAGHGAPACSDKVTHNWDTPQSFPYANMELTRLSPMTPFTVLGVRYILGGAGTGGAIPCDSTVPHRVEVWTDLTPIPAASPPAATTLKVAPASQRSYLATSVSLAAPLRLQSGQHLFVAVELANTHNNKAMCIVTCGVGTTGERSYTSWTNAPVNNSPPYSWTSYRLMGSRQELSILALGFSG